MTRALALWTLLAVAIVAAVPLLLASGAMESDWRAWQRGRDLMRGQP